MKEPLEPHALDQLFRSARTFNRFTDRPVDDEVIHALYELSKWGPTSQNSQPARYLFLRSRESRAQLLPALIGANVEKTSVAPLTVIVATDSRFYEHLPQQFPGYDARAGYIANPALATTVAFRNASLQGAYLIIAARALGLDCGPMSGFDNAKVDAAYFPDGRFKSNFLINLGYGDPAGLRPRGQRLPFDEVARIE